ncbi:hypothetical protein [Streptomyces sp. WAC07061]|nr:hypothetical protein [Streptomyces sp. WAC07061]
MTRWWSSFTDPLPNLWLGVSVEDQKTAERKLEGHRALLHPGRPG